MDGPTDRSSITALILAGGGSRRMGGRDKGLLPLDGRPLVAHVLDAIRPQVGAVMISANRNQASYRALGVPVLGDPLAGSLGPLAGMLAGLRAMRSPFLLTLPCDGPFVAGDLAQRLLRALLADSAEVSVAHDGERLNPVYALLRAGLAADLAHALGQGERQARAWISGRHWVAADLSDRPAMFYNINTPDDYARAQRRGPERG